jgi:hypothetical protein
VLTRGMLSTSMRAIGGVLQISVDYPLALDEFYFGHVSGPPSLVEGESIVARK